MRIQLLDSIINPFYSELAWLDSQEARKRVLKIKDLQCEGILEKRHDFGLHHMMAAVNTKGKDRRHHVSITDRAAMCSCPDFEFRKRPQGKHCKHIIYLCLALRGELQRPPISKIK